MQNGGHLKLLMFVFVRVHLLKVENPRKEVHRRMTPLCLTPQTVAWELPWCQGIGDSQIITTDRD